MDSPQILVEANFARELKMAISEVTPIQRISVHELKCLH